MIEEFKKYVEKFDRSDKDIDRKYYHSLRVKDLCQILAKHLNLDEDNRKIVEVIGLLHDYGRFMQWQKYHTYNDSLSIDHGDYAVEELFKKGQIKKFWPDIKDYDEIYDAIKYHNKLEIPSYLSDHNKLLCKIIRDADKLDILYLYVSKSLVIQEDGEISKNVKEAFDNERTVNKKDEKTAADHTIVVLALIYDMNFDYSFKHLKDYKIFDQIFENVKNKEKFRIYFDKVNEYIDKKVREME